MSSVDRDWSELPPELLGSIAQQTAVDTYIRFGAVCTSWASAASPRDGLFPPLAPQMPSLLLLGDEGDSCTLVTFHDRRCRRIAPLPEIRGKWVIGSQDGWLALLDERSEVSLLNPLTRAQIHLPSVATIPGVNPVYNGGSLSEYLYTERVIWDPFSYTLPDFRCMNFKKVVLSSRPAADNYTAVAIFSVIPAYATADGGGKWTLLTSGPAITDIIYREGKFLMISYGGKLWELDFTGPSPRLVVIADGWEIARHAATYDKYLVDSSGDLLQVWRRTGPDNHTTQDIKVMKFDPQRAAWTRMKSLGDRSIFLGLSYSISLSVREVSELKPNCIYFTEIIWDWCTDDDIEEKLMTRDVGVFNLEDGTYDRYHPPDPRFNWPPSLWFTPNLL